jgi:Carboxypeptidase regulatory-like domain
MNQHFFRKLCMIAGLVFTLAGSAASQTVGGTILGRMEDPSGAVIPVGSVVLKNQETGVGREVTTDAGGRYLVPNLTPGTYFVSGAAKGFATTMVRDVVLDVGSEATVNLKMEVGSVGQNVVVEAAGANVELSSSEMSEVVGTKTITELPLNGRDWTQLAQLQPGIALVRSQSTTDTNRAQRGNGVDLSISGGRPSVNNYRLNGISINDYSNTAPGNAMGSNLGVDAIQEFSVESSTPAAEYGKVSGGVVNAITRSGTNLFHGSVYYFLRNSALDARNFFDVTHSALPFRRNNYGASAGGPLKRNKTFWFFDYEGIRESLASTVISTVPSASIRSTAVPAIQPYLTFFPLPNGPLAANGQTGSFIFASNRQSHDDFLTGKFDHKFSDKDSINAAYQWDNGGFNAPEGLNNMLVGAASRRNDITFEEAHTFSPTMVNSFRVGFARTVASNNTVLDELNSALKDPALSFIPGLQPGTITISGLTLFSGGVNGPDPNLFHYNSYQTYDDIDVVRGIHSFKFGAVYERMQDNFFAGYTTDGAFTFGSVANFMANIPTTFSGLLPGSDDTRGIRQSLAGAYAQDAIRLRSNLTINLGVRYEMVTVPSEINGKMASLKNITDPQVTVGQLFNNPTLKNFSPRVGFAWDPFKDGKTSIRGGFGIYDVLPLAYIFTNRFPRTPPFFENGSVNYTPKTSPANFFPNGAFQTLTPATFRTIYVQPNPPRNFVTQYNLNIQRQLFSGTILTVAFVGSRGYNMLNSQDGADMALPTTTNPFTWSASTPLLNPNFSRIAGTVWNLNSHYAAMQSSLKKSLSHGLMAQVAWSYQKSTDEASSTFSTNEFANTMNNPMGILYPGLNKGLSDFDVRNLVVVNFLYNLPTPKSWNGFAKGVLGGWQAGSIFTAGSGLPFSVMLNNDRAGTKNSLTSEQLGQRPNYIEGCQTTNSGQVQYANTSCFSFPAQYTLGNLGRNSLTGPGLQNLDFSLFKNQSVTRISETFRVQFRAEFFNILNHTNFALPDSTHTTMWNVNGVLNSNAGQLTSTQTASRQIQFGLKLVW